MDVDEVRDFLSRHMSTSDVDALVESVLMWDGQADGLLLSLCWGAVEHGLDAAVEHIFKFILRSKKAAKVLEGTDYEQFFKTLVKIAESFLATIHIASPKRLN